jgi:hypothetical protein
MGRARCLKERDSERRERRGRIGIKEVKKGGVKGYVSVCACYMGSSKQRKGRSMDCVKGVNPKSVNLLFFYWEENGK